MISDVGMPGQDGYMLIRQVRELGAQRGFWFPAVDLTAYAHPKERTRAFSAGYQVHLVKPVEPGQLVTTIAGLITPAVRE
jgi:CheY-like chemotaxis protein